jgi:Tfp pilus assembly protein FimT
MILPIGKRSGDSQPRRAFTLVELLLVMTLLIIVISVSAPSLGRFFRGRTLDSEARRMLALTRHGQGRAVSEGVPMVLWLDVKARKYGLEEEPGYSESDSKAVEFTLDKDLQMEIVNNDISPVLSPGINPATGSPLSGANRRNVPEIRFQPDGTFSEASPLAVRLLDRDGAMIGLEQSRNRLYYEIGNSSNQWQNARR